MRLLTGFVGKNRDFKKWLAAQKQRRTAQVIYLQRCELCGQLAKGSICRKCEPMFRQWTKKMATEVAAQKNHPDPSIA